MTDEDPEPEEPLNSLEVPPGHKAEFIEGDINVSPAPQFEHQHILMKIIRPMALADWDPHGEIGVAASANNRFIPDLTVVPRGFAFNAQRSWQSPVGIELVVEVTSSNADKDRGGQTARLRLRGDPAVSAHRP
jgi:Uma2 family endonuclease